MKFSVVINNYNNGPYLRACLESVFVQTRAADEIIVYDDGSSDGSIEYLRSLGKRIHLIEGKRDQLIYGLKKPITRLRQAHAIHRGIEAASGDWILMLDGDDCFLPQKLERYSECVRTHPEALLVQSPMLWVNAEGNPLGNYKDPRFHTPDPVAEVRRTQDCDLGYPCSALMVRRSFALSVMPLTDLVVPNDLATDTILMIWALHKGKIITLEEPLTIWRQNLVSMSNRESSRVNYAARQTRKRHATYNSIASKLGHRPISLWKNRRYYRQLLGALLPKSLQIAINTRLSKLYRAAR